MYHPQPKKFAKNPHNFAERKGQKIPGYQGFIRGQQNHAGKTFTQMTVTRNEKDFQNANASINMPPSPHFHLKSTTASTSRAKTVGYAGFVPGHRHQYATTFGTATLQNEVVKVNDPNQGRSFFLNFRGEDPKKPETPKSKPAAVAAAPRPRPSTTAPRSPSQLSTMPMTPSPKFSRQRSDYKREESYAAQPVPRRGFAKGPPLTITVKSSTTPFFCRTTEVCQGYCWIQWFRQGLSECECCDICPDAAVCHCC